MGVKTWGIWYGGQFYNIYIIYSTLYSKIVSMYGNFGNEWASIDNHSLGVDPPLVPLVLPAVGTKFEI